MKLLRLKIRKMAEPPIRAVWSQEKGLALVHIRVDKPPNGETDRRVQLHNQNGFLREIVLRPSKVTAVLTIGHPLGDSTYLYLKRGEEEVVIPQRFIPPSSPLGPRGMLGSLIDGLTDGYVSFSRSALEQIDALLSNL